MLLLALRFCPCRNFGPLLGGSVAKRLPTDVIEEATRLLGLSCTFQPETLRVLFNTDAAFHALARQIIIVQNLKEEQFWSELKPYLDSAREVLRTNKKYIKSGLTIESVLANFVNDFLRYIKARRHARALATA